MDVSSHTVSFPAGGAVPDWVHLLPAGVFSGVDGRGPYKLRDPQKVIDVSMAAGKLPIDENHATVLATATGGAAPARGWIVEMQARPDGIWGRVEWTTSGQALMSEGAYKGISPVFSHGKDGAVIAIKNAALTNNPNLAQLHAMHTANTEGHMDKLAICTALGLAGTVEDDAVLTALQTMRTENARLTAELSTVKATTVPVTEVVQLQTRIDTMEVAAKTEKATAFVDAAIAAGKPIVSTRAQMIAMHVASPADAEALVNGLPSLHAKGGGKAKTVMQDAESGDDIEAMSASDMAICAKMGVTKEQFMANRKKMATTEGSAA